MRKVWLVLGALALANLTTAFTAANVIPQTWAGRAAQASDANAMKPSECDALNLTAIVTGGAGGAASELVVGTGANDTLTGGGGDDCIVAGAGDDSLSGGLGTDICIGGAGSDGYATCETTVDTPPTIALVKDVGSATCGGTSHTVTVPAGGVAAGNTLIIRFGMRGLTTGAVAAADSRGNTYTVDRDVANLSGNGARTAVLSGHASTALVAGDTITVTHPDGAAEGVVITEFSGITAVGRVDITAGTTGSSATPTASVTSTNADDLLYGAVANPTLLSYTEAGGWTTATHLPMNCGGGGSRGDSHGAYRVVSSTGAYTYNPTLSATAVWAEALVAYKAA